MSKGGKTTTTQQAEIPAWLQTRFQNNLDQADFLTSGVTGRYGSPSPQTGATGYNVMGQNFEIPGMPGQAATPSNVPGSFIADFSPDTENYFDAARGYTGSADQFRDIAGRGPYLLGDAGQVTNAGNVGDIAGVGNISAGPDITAQQIAARRGSEFMSDYMNPYMRDVVDTTLADYDVGTDRTMAGRSAARDASGAFGNRSAIADAIFQADSDRGRAGTAANLRAAGFNTALGAGQADAGRFLSADTSNAANNLSASSMNAANRLNAAGMNAGNTLQTQLANQANQRGNIDRMNNLGMFNVGAQNQFRVGDQAARQQADLTSLNALGMANNSDLARIGMLGDVGGRQDALNQARLREPLDMLAWNQSLLSGVPVPQMGTTTQSSNPGLLGTLGGLGSLGFGLGSLGWNPFK
jgi:hypothetical protein